jgi:m7GpppX diphosphatase
MESPSHYYSTDIQSYIETEKKRPSKQWIGNVLQGLQEKDQIKLETNDFILLPDTERINRYWYNTKKNSQGKQISNSIMINWLGIVKDTTLHTLRDLRGEHVNMLESMRDMCLAKIHEETGIPVDEIMVYIHYHPSVYHLHVHFAYPYMQFNHRDIYRIHSINTIIENLKMNPNYYALANLQLSVNKDSIVYKTITNS